MQLEGFKNEANQVITELKALKPKEAVIVHHDDADGLCSAAITMIALERERIKAKAFAWKKSTRK